MRVAGRVAPAVTVLKSKVFSSKVANIFYSMGLLRNRYSVMLVGVLHV